MILRSAKQLKIEPGIKKLSPKGRRGAAAAAASAIAAAAIDESNEVDEHGSLSEASASPDPLISPDDSPLVGIPPMIPFMVPLQQSPATLQYSNSQHLPLVPVHVQLHPSQLPLSELERDYTLEYIAPPLAATLHHFNSFPQLSPNSIDTSMDDFLEQEGINIPYYVSDVDSLDGFTREVHRLVVLYTNESVVISHECDRYAAKLLNMLKEQSKVRYVSQEEIDVKTKIIHGKFENVRTSMRVCVCGEIKKAVAVFGYKPKKHQKKCFRRKVTRILNTWFCDHLTNPYPTDLEKQALSKVCGLNITQICNWFANKRIRHMRASKEQDAKTQG